MTIARSADQFWATQKRSPATTRYQAPAAEGGPQPGDTKDADNAPIVTIFGAGIAGLSVAHELIERGFYVQVVEPTMSPDEEFAVEVGGLTRNQFGRVREVPEALHAVTKARSTIEASDSEEPAEENAGPEAERLQPEDETAFREHVASVQQRRSAQMQAVQERFATPWRIRFKRGKEQYDPALADAWGVENATKLVAFWNTFKTAYHAYGAAPNDNGTPPDDRHDTESLDGRWLARERIFVEIRGHTNGDEAEGANRAVSERWARQVLDEIRKLNDGPDAVPTLGLHFQPIGVGSAEPLGDQRDPVWRARSNRVEFRIVQQLIPGEHGYRFFPAFYRHLFDLMRRTPILDGKGHASGQTAFDLLVPTKDLGIAAGDNRRLEPIETRRVQSAEELRKLSELFLRRLGVTPRDILRFQTRLLKFLTSSPERRQKEYEAQSWWTFLGGDDDRGYSQPMRRYLMETSQALVAMNAEETDARSQGNIVSQLQLHYLKDQCDYTLNGPTSSVWLRPWKKYLKAQGVHFFIGELAALK